MNADRSESHSIDLNGSALTARGLWIVAGCAVLMGLPTLWGTFAFGDDHQLVLNHVLVNHPSIAHAIELFRIIHRDLYQPLPLLSFQVEFAIAEMLGLRERGVEGIAWLFHLDNVLLHAVNACLVWMLARRVATTLRLTQVSTIAVTAGLLFAVHPLQVEVVAWINGRMMLLSTLFALLAMIALSQWLMRGGWWRAAAVVLCALCCQISKVRVEFPLLLLLILAAYRRKPSLPFSLLWLGCAAITAAATLVNLQATDRAGMFEGAAQNLTGPGTVRALRSLAWYFEHFFIPVGLAPWYPAPGVVRWMEWETLRAVLTLLPVAAFGVWSLVKNRPLCGGLAWFLLAIATTVQLVPTRNTLAADRYMYLPIVGLVWMAGVALMELRSKWKPPAHFPTRRWAYYGGAGVALMLGLSWHNGWFYNEPLRKITRIANLFPEALHVWERAGWAYYHDGQYEKAIELSQREFQHDDLDAHSDALEVIGAAQLKLGRYEEALASLRRAIEADPEKPGSYYRIATVLEDIGRHEEALAMYEKAVSMAPLKNPWIMRLGTVYRDKGRTDDARRMFERALKNNPYDIPATLGLAELDIAEQTPDGFTRAENRLRELLAWESGHGAARSLLGVVLNSTGRTDEAANTYAEVIRDDPSNVTALLNLAALHSAAGDSPRARDLYLRAADEPLVLSEMLAIHDFLVVTRDLETLLVFWSRQQAKLPASEDVREMATFSRLIAGKSAELPEVTKVIEAQGAPQGPRTAALRALSALMSNQPVKATQDLHWLLQTGRDSQGARERLLAALEIYDEMHPNNPWTYCLAARLLLAQGSREAAEAFTGLCQTHCIAEDCRTFISELESLLAGDGSGNPRR